MDKPDTQNTEEDTFDDLDLMDDSIEEEVWDDPAADEDWVDDEENDSLDDDHELAASPKGKPSKKGKSSMVSMLLLLGVIGGGGAGAYFFMNNQQMMNNEVSYPPVVQNVMPEDSKGSEPSELSKVDETSIEAGDILPENNNETSTEGETLANDPFGNLIQETPIAPENKDPGVLTPMPNIDNIKDTELANLDTDEIEIKEAVQSPFSENSPIPVIQADALPSTDEIEIDENEITPENSSSSEPTLPETEMPALEIEEKSLSEIIPENKVQENPAIELEEDVMLEKTEIEHKDKIGESEESNTQIEEIPVTESKPLESNGDPEETKLLEAAKPSDEVNTPSLPEKSVEVVPETIKKAEEKKDIESTPVKKVEEKPKAEAKKAVSKYKASDWVLRSAQNGQAVIYNKRSRETKSVETGNTVSGIGRIGSISKVNGKWIVKGSEGSVKQ